MLESNNNDEGVPYTIKEAANLIGWRTRKLKYQVESGAIPCFMIGAHKHILGKTIKEIKSGVSFPIVKNEEDK